MRRVHVHAKLHVLVLIISNVNKMKTEYICSASKTHHSTLLLFLLFVLYYCDMWATVRSIIDYKWAL